MHAGEFIVRYGNRAGEADGRRRTSIAKLELTDDPADGGSRFAAGFEGIVVDNGPDLNDVTQPLRRAFLQKLFPGERGGAALLHILQRRRGEVQRQRHGVE